MLRIKLIACKVMARELYYLASQTENVIDIQFMRQQLHLEPEKLRANVQRVIDQTESEGEPYDAIALVYGLCSNGIVGLTTSRLPLVVPRGHDCITLLLGSKEKYQELFEKYSGGAYWYTAGWVEHAPMPSRKRFETLLAEYREKYGEDNAQYLMEMEQDWMTKYNRAVHIHWPELKPVGTEEYARDAADYLKWEYSQEAGSSGILRDLIEGNWDNERFLTLRPGEKLRPSYGPDIITA